MDHVITDCLRGLMMKAEFTFVSLTLIYFNTTNAITIS